MSKLINSAVKYKLLLINLRRIIMKKFYIYLLLLATPISVSTTSAQELPNFPFQELSRDSLLIMARTIIDSAQCRILITVDENGKPQARTMSTFPLEDNMTIWLGTNPRSRKVKQIKNNPNVMVYYYDTKSFSYVSVAGQARIVDDPDKRAKYWKEDWTRFYPDPEKDYTLIEVTPKRIEICSFKYKLFWDSTGKPAFVEF
jgi:general stress protein 26